MRYTNVLNLLVVAYAIDRGFSFEYKDVEVYTALQQKQEGRLRELKEKALEIIRKQANK